MTEGTPRKPPPRKRTRKAPAPKPQEVRVEPEDMRPEPEDMRPEPVEGQDEGASTSSARKPPRKRTRKAPATKAQEVRVEPEDASTEPGESASQESEKATASARAESARKPPRKRTRKAAAPKPQEMSPEPKDMRPEPVEGQDEPASTSAVLSSSKGAVLSSSKDSADIHEESDEKAPIKGAVPEGESEPDAETKPESLTGEAPAVGSDATAAEEDEAQLAAAEPTAEVLQVREGMFGVKGSGDTSGYGGLTRVVEFPGGAIPPFGGWWDQVYERIGALIPNFSDVIIKVVIYRGEITFHVAREHLADLVRYLRDDAHLRFEFCSSVSGVHYPADKDSELHAVYHLQSMTHNRRLRLEVSAPDRDPHIPSVVATYPTADWHERETYDMFGIIFDGHPALTRILMPDDWPGHPQRKDYPLGGIPVEYKGATIPPPDQRRSYS
jgi:NADH-quinone oxidoreductase subunit C